MKNGDYVDSKFILILSGIVIMLGFLCAGCSSVKPEMKDNTATIQVPIKPEIKTVAGVDSSQNVKTDNTAGRDLISKINNDSKMIEELFQKYKETNDKLIESYKEMNKEQSNLHYLIIKILIVQLCALLGLFIKKDWDLDKRMLKMIADDAEREDAEDKK